MRSGFGTPSGEGASRFETPARPVPLDTLLTNSQLPMTMFEDLLYMQATMFQPVGGMDQIAVGIERNLTRRAVRRAVVTRIRHSARHIEVIYTDGVDGTTYTVSGDYLVCTIPFPVLAGVDTDLPASYKAAIGAVQYDYSNKIAFEAPRFWEADQIYGGITFVGGDTSLIWYPSVGLHSDRGMLLSCYTSGKRAQTVEKQPLAQQIASARAAIEMVHPGHSVECVDPLVVN